MSVEIIKGLIKGWRDSTECVLKLNKIPISKMQELLNNTYSICAEYCSAQQIPKEFVELFNEICYYDQILTMFSADEDSNYSFDYYQTIITFIKDIEIGFYKGKYDEALTKAIKENVEKLSEV